MIKQLIEQFAPQLKPLPPSLNAQAILWAIYHSERYTSSNPSPRFEKAYAPGGIYYDTAQHVRDAYEEYGRDAACSYSNFQIMYIAAVELGYSGPPRALDKDSFALPYVVKYINRRVLERGADTPEEVADAYNSGSYTDSHKPEGYMRRFRTFYDQALRRIEKWQQELTSKPADSTIEPKPLPGE